VDVPVISLLGFAIDDVCIIAGPSSESATLAVEVRLKVRNDAVSGEPTENVLARRYHLDPDPTLLRVNLVNAISALLAHEIEEWLSIDGKRERPYHPGSDEDDEDA
jgi:hypothetical protein